MLIPPSLCAFLIACLSIWASIFNIIHMYLFLKSSFLSTVPKENLKHNKLIDSKKRRRSCIHSLEQLCGTLKQAWKFYRKLFGKSIFESNKILYLVYEPFHFRFKMNKRLNPKRLDHSYVSQVKGDMILLLSKKQHGKGGDCRVMLFGFVCFSKKHVPGLFFFFFRGK